MDNLIGSVVNGVYTKTDASNELTKANNNVSTSKTEAKKDNGYSQEMFLKLLVAEMQHQDPMEPTDNSQYVAQLASFTQIQAIQAVQDDMADMQANSLVGKFVALTDENQEIPGRVDYVRTDDDGQIWASVNNKEYEIDKITSVVNESYYNAVSIADTFITTLEKLPDIEQLSLGDLDKVKYAVDLYNSMDDYSRSFVNTAYEDYLKKLVSKMGDLEKAKEEADTEQKAASSATTENSGAAATDSTEASTETTESSDESEETEEAAAEAVEDDGQ
jgi:flagellar basal-body rod modification protein FlgD